MIQLDNGVRESLSFVSEAIGPPNPINIQLRKWYYFCSIYINFINSLLN